MAYLEDFEHDVLISYAHVDNVPRREGDKGWAERFERQLSVRLLKRFGEPVEVWRDPKLHRAELFNKVIERAIQGAGIMIALITHGYLKSDYCNQEIEWFRDKAVLEPSGLAMGNHLRLFPVLLYNIPPAEWPEPCQGTSGFKFYDAEGDEHGEPLDPDSHEFDRQMRELVEELHALFMRMTEARRKEGVEPAARAAGSFSVFLAHPPEDLGPTRRLLAEGLKSAQFEILDGIPPPHDEASHREAVQAIVKRADLCVHLLSTRPGEPLEEERLGRTYPLEQANIAREHGRSLLILLPSEFEIEDVTDEAYAKFVKALRDAPRDATRLELVKTGRHQMLDEVLAKRRKLEAAARAQQTVNGDGNTAFIDLHTNDVPHATDLVAFLAEHSISPVMIPSTELSPKLGMSLFEDNLKKAQLFIVVFGTVARNWVENRLNEALKLILSNHLSTHIGVYVAPPHKAEDEVTFPRNFDVLINMDKFDPHTLEGFVQKTGEG